MLIKQIKEYVHSIDICQYNEDVALGLLRDLDHVTENIIDKQSNAMIKTKFSSLSL